MTDSAARIEKLREELRRTRARLSDQERISLSDSLTGAWNRRYLDIALSDAMQRGRRSVRPTPSSFTALLNRNSRLR